MENWNLKQQLTASIKEKGGFVNCHGHFDKAFYITKEGLNQSMLDMEVKWHMSDQIKKDSNIEDIAQRLRTALDIMISQGSKITCTFIDAYDVVGHRAIDAANLVKEG